MCYNKTEDDRRRGGEELAQAHRRTCPPKAHPQTEEVAEDGTFLTEGCDFLHRPVRGTRVDTTGYPETVEIEVHGEWYHVDAPGRLG